MPNILSMVSPQQPPSAPERALPSPCRSCGKPRASARSPCKEVPKEHSKFSFGASEVQFCKCVVSFHLSHGFTRQSYIGQTRYPHVLLIVSDTKREGGRNSTKLLALTGPVMCGRCWPRELARRSIVRPLIQLQNQKWLTKWCDDTPKKFAQDVLLVGQR